MTKEECREVLAAGIKLLIADDFVEEPHDSITKFLGTVQTVEKWDLVGTGWVYFEDVPQPFAISEIVGVYYDVDPIDDETKLYDHGDMNLIFGEVLS